jgi:hypothetical protein
LKAPALIELIDFLDMLKLDEHPDPQSSAPAMVKVPFVSLAQVHPPHDKT